MGSRTLITVERLARAGVSVAAMADDLRVVNEIVVRALVIQDKNDFNGFEPTKAAQAIEGFFFRLGSFRMSPKECLIRVCDIKAGHFPVVDLTEKMSAAALQYIANHSSWSERGLETPPRFDVTLRPSIQTTSGCRHGSQSVVKGVCGGS